MAIVNDAFSHCLTLGEAPPPYSTQQVQYVQTLECSVTLLFAYNMYGSYSM